MQHILEVYNTLHTCYESTHFKMDDIMKGTIIHNIKMHGSVINVHANMDRIQDQYYHLMKQHYMCSLNES